MVIVELINPKTGNTHVIKLSPPVTSQEVSKKMQGLVVGTSSGWVVEEGSKILVVPDRIVRNSIITIREEKEDAIPN